MKKTLNVFILLSLLLSLGSAFAQEDDDSMSYDEDEISVPVDDSSSAPVAPMEDDAGSLEEEE